MAQQMVEARKLAATLPIDYRRLVHAVVVGREDSNDDELVSEYRTFLSVFGEDPDEQLTQMIAASGPYCVFPDLRIPATLWKLTVSKSVTPSDQISDCRFLGFVALARICTGSRLPIVAGPCVPGRSTI